MEKFCVKCGAKFTEGSSFCVKCGNKIEVEQPTPPQPGPPATPPPQVPSQPVAPAYTPAIKPPSKTLKYVGVIAVVAILIFA
jgi:predicted amidophosphoribosyltransferase